MSKVRLADYVMQRLVAEGISHVYTVTGRGSLYLTDALAKESKLTAVCMHHEQAAGYAAVAEASLTSRVAVCLTSTGCGATNALSAVLSAWQDEIPTLFISGQNTLRETTHHVKTTIRTFGEQETDIVALVKPITKFAAMLENPLDIISILDMGINSLNDRRRGPVWIDIPIDLQSAQVEIPINGCSKVPKEKAVVLAQLEIFQQYVRGSSRPVVLLGAGAFHDRAEAEVEAFAKRHSIPVVYESSAVDVIPASSPIHIGSVGAMGCSRAGNMAIQNSDLVIALGTNLRASTIGDDAPSFAREAKVIHLDADDTQLRPDLPTIDFHASVDLKTFFAALNEFHISKTFDEWLATCRRWRTEMPKLFLVDDAESSSESIDLYEVVESINRTEFDRDVVFVTDSGLVELVVPTNIELDVGQRVIHPSSQGAMGFALPAAVGVAISSGRKVVVVVGDGSIMMNIQELQTIAHHHLPILILVINNDAYSIIRKRQKELFRKRTIGTDPSNGISCPEFKSVAAAFNLAYSSASTLNELDDRLSEHSRVTAPTIIEVMCRSDQDYVRMARTINSKGKSVARPLEDQQPFLDREFLKSQMIVAPLNIE